MHTYTTTASNKAYWIKLSVRAASLSAATGLFQEYILPPHGVHEDDEYLMAAAVDPTADPKDFVYKLDTVETGEDDESAQRGVVVLTASGCNG